MSNPSSPSKTIHITLWVFQILIAVFMLSGTILKCMPIAKLSAMMPWTGQVPEYTVRVLALIDLAGALGLLLPMILKYKRALTVYAALGIALLMLCATVFHFSRNEGSVTVTNIIVLAMSLFIAWGRRYLLTQHT